MTSDRAMRLREALDILVSGESAEVTAADCSDPWDLGVCAFVASWRLDHRSATQFAERAIGVLPDLPAGDPAATVLAYAVRVLAGAGTGVKGTWTDLAPGLTPTGDPLADALPMLGLIDGHGDDERFARYALAEAALACGRVGIAQEIPDIGGASGFLDGHPYSTVMTVLAARIAGFGGRIDEARILLDSLPDATAPRLQLLVAATRSLVDGNAAAPAVVRDLAGRIERGGHDLDDRLELGCVLLCAYGLVAIGDVDRATDLVAGFDMSHAMVIDRVLAIELMVAAAERAGDLPTAESGLAAAEALADDPIAESTLDRIRSRIALLAGTPASALLTATRAIERADGEGRAIEAAEGRIVSARARVASGDRGGAARGLEAPVATADVAGHRAFRRAAGRALLGTGRRLRPFPGSEDAGLSDREREVFTLILAGYENSEIAAELHISPHTARSHVSRVLAAYGTPTRATLAAYVAASMQDRRTAGIAAASLDELTPRQRAVVAEVITGESNAQIAARLGITTRTVEKHVNDVMRRWRIGSRVELVFRGSGISLDGPFEK